MNIMDTKTTVAKKEYIRNMTTQITILQNFFIPIKFPHDEDEDREIVITTDRPDLIVPLNSITQLKAEETTSLIVNVRPQVEAKEEREGVFLCEKGSADEGVELGLDRRLQVTKRPSKRDRILREEG
jgi:hypothetical protein